MHAIRTGHVSATWVEDPAELAGYLEGWATRTPVALDTEFVRERTYWPRLALVQLAVPGQTLLVDPLADGMCPRLMPLLLDSATVKLMHGASEDTIALHHACGAVPAPIYDTQIAAALAGLGAGLSYQALVRELLGVEIEKHETRSDWLRRPLSESQKHYAAEDVRHLHTLHEILDRKLAALGRREWLAEDCRRLGEGEPGVPEPWPHLALRGAQNLDPEAQRRLWSLLRWRDRRALELDRPRGWILGNDLAIALARRPPSDRPALDRFLDAWPKAPRRDRGGLWSALSDPSPAPDGFPLAVAQDDAFKRRLRQMQDAVAPIAAGLGLPEPVLASRRQLEFLLASGEWPESLSGWRRALLEPALAPLLPYGD